MNIWKLILMCLILNFWWTDCRKPLCAESTMCSTDSGSAAVVNECTEELISALIHQLWTFFFIAIHGLQVWLEVMIFPCSPVVQGAEASPSRSQHKPRWLKQQTPTPTKLPQHLGLSRRLQGQDWRRRSVCSKSAKIVVHKTQRSVSWITIMEFSVFILWSLLHRHSSAASDSFTPTPTVCLSVHLSISFPRFLFHSPPVNLSVSLHLSMCVCLSPVSPSLVSALSAHCIFVQISNTDRSLLSLPLRRLHPPSSALVRLGVS